MQGLAGPTGCKVARTGRWSAKRAATNPRQIDATARGRLLTGGASCKGCDAKANRDAARQRGICPVIPYRANAADRPAFFPKALYRARARIEQTIGKLKRFKRIALRCEKTATNYAALIAFACGLILVKSVHTA